MAISSIEGTVKMKRFALIVCLAAGLLLASADLNTAQAQYGYGYRSYSPNCLYGAPAYRTGYTAYRGTSLYARPGLTVTSGYVSPIPRSYYYRAPVAPLPYYRTGYGYGYGRSYPVPRVPSPGLQLRIGF